MMSNHIMSNHYSILLDLCTGIVKEHKTRHNQFVGTTKYTEYYYNGAEIGFPENTYIKINSTATSGTIGRLINIEPKMLQSNNTQISSYSGTYILEVDGRKQPVRIKSTFCKTLKDYTGSTEYVRNVKKHAKKEKKLPINKFKQELYVGALIFGTVGKRIAIGRVTRWTDHSVWGILGDSKEFKFESVTETFIIADQEHIEQELTFATLKGWQQ